MSKLEKAPPSLSSKGNIDNTLSAVSLPSGVSTSIHATSKLALEYSLLVSRRSGTAAARGSSNMCLAGCGSQCRLRQPTGGLGDIVHTRKPRLGIEVEDKPCYIGEEGLPPGPCICLFYVLLAL